ncbi:MAG TPA: CPBP family intramembrane glutamic endopeptidase [Sphingomicrobium sp.]|jgi:membrane protease YdiL (CAAX protease family)|nr:CPBP family intramembrane glutamic endopeptidase [Sphingomicrobium sp.]
MTSSEFLGRNGRRAAVGYLLLWAASTGYIALRGGDWIFPIASLLIFGLVLSGIILFLTRKMDAPGPDVRRPARESLTLLVYILLYAVLLIGLWLGSIKRAIPAGATQDLAVLAYKLVIHVGIPAALILIVGGAVRWQFDAGVRRRGFWLTLIILCGLMFALLSVVSPALKQIGALNLAPAAALAWVLASWAWNSMEAGLCEEFLFRASLQSRLTAWFQSPVSAIALTSVLFALSHWPGLYLRGGPDVDGWSPDPIQVAAFTIATLSPLSVALGVLWARSRSLLLVILVHGAIDALPNTVDLFSNWR